MMMMYLVQRCIGWGVDVKGREMHEAGSIPMVGRTTEPNFTDINKSQKQHKI